ncbi:hypothetical protein AGROH133_07007 [Agrobacterium tumefaciens]|nr:hypothetical protein AGROH133_07007 [Agrobacterium tumefaciens]
MHLFCRTFAIRDCDLLSRPASRVRCILSVTAIKRRRGMTDYMNMRLTGMSGFSGMVVGGYMSRGIDLR